MSSYSDYVRAANELGIKPIRIDEFESLIGIMSVNEILDLSSKVSNMDKPMGAGGN
jgi:hypothetical protein